MSKDICWAGFLRKGKTEEEHKSPITTNRELVTCEYCLLCFEKEDEKHELKPEQYTHGECPNGPVHHSEIVAVCNCNATRTGIVRWESGKIQGFFPKREEPKFDSVEKPKHYNSHPSGIECIEVVEHHDFNTGNAIKYLWRAGLKGKGTSGKELELEDLKKAKWYVERKIKSLEKQIEIEGISK